MTREEALNRAKELICGEREKQYGDPEELFTEVATLWTHYLGVDYLITATDAAIMMALLKVARITSSHWGGRYSEDNFVDLIGYAAIAAELEGLRQAQLARLGTSPDKPDRPAFASTDEEIPHTSYL